jgi:hypothetical protein
MSWNELPKVEQFSILMIVIGSFLAIADRVRAGGVILAVASGLYAYTKYKRVGMKRRIELFLPLGIACALLVVSVTLPHAR